MTPLHIPLGGGRDLHEARFVDRPNQFVLRVAIDGQVVQAHMADRGRLTDVLTPGRPLLVVHRPEPGRKTRWQAVAAVLDEGRLCSLDTLLPNRLVGRALERDLLDELGDYTRFRREQTIGASRFDFVVDHAAGDRTIVEVKSVGRIDPDGVARFPDAPTSRGRRHVTELAELCAAEDTAAAVLFLVQGDHARHVAIDTDMDPDLHNALVEARAAGLTLLARRCRLDRGGLWWGEPLPVEI